MNELDIVFLIGHFVLALTLVVAGCVLATGILYAAVWVKETWGRYTTEDTVDGKIVGKRVTDYTPGEIVYMSPTTLDELKKLQEFWHKESTALLANIDFEHCYGSYDHKHCECWWDNSDCCCHCGDDSPIP